jgi:membrane protease YdiL (CAAX protease family)
MGFERGRRGLVVGAALAGAVGGVYAAGVACPRTRRLFLDERALRLSRARLLEEVFLQVPVGTVLLEEVGFRGVVYGLVDRSYGAVVATVVSSGLFGVWHVLPALDMARANPAVAAQGTGRLVAGSVASTGLAGAFFCELRRRHGLLAPAVLHTATNSLGYLAARIAARLQRSGRASR